MEKRLSLSFSIAEDTQKLIDEAKELLSSKFPKGASLEELFVAGLIEASRWASRISFTLFTLRVLA
ncbi:MAG: hypothetical protein R3A13_10995 [Bdellovibrionota bacterium]